MRTLGTAVTTLAVGLIAASTVSAAPVTSPDEVCSTVADPCVISTTVEVDSSFPLDFGLRTVQVAAGGNLVGTVELLAGAFEVTAGPTVRWMDLNGPPFVGRATITARRACSADGTTPCSTDTACADAMLGACTVGDGGIRISGSLRSAEAPTIGLRAVGDVAVEGEIIGKGKEPTGDGGNVTFESEQGSVELAALIDLSAGRNTDYGTPGFGGSVLVRAAGDVTVRNPLYLRGAAGTLEVDAGGNISVTASIFGETLPGSDFIGGTIDLSAGANLDIIDGAGKGSTVLNVSGSKRKSRYGGSYGGPGGYGFFNAGGNITVSDNVQMKGDSGQSAGYTDDLPIGACWYFEAGGALDMEPLITARGKGGHGYGCVVEMAGDDAATLRREAIVTTHSMFAADIALYSNHGPVRMDGRLDARGRSRVDYGSFSGEGGGINIEGGDVVIGGRAMTGGGSGARGIFVDACRLRLESGSSINAARNRQFDFLGYTYLTIRESMVAERGSRIASLPEGSNTIRFRDAAKPPVLEGSIRPVPILLETPALSGCPVCGNSEVDAGETCDDGNTSSGDGCSDLCQTE